jgi:hypothetical protein
MASVVWYFLYFIARLFLGFLFMDEWDHDAD